jgi:hypothetical protein
MTENMSIRVCRYNSKYEQCNLSLLCSDCIIYKDWEFNHSKKINKIDTPSNRLELLRTMQSWRLED